uniref:Uncharacterized protein n=1 Tax=Lactuca sativa TaxID=4236 RepID=A0A9R1WKL2_LACSA|nr:hypothetical protein LSAT_V11C100043360 [Lactuca sativa]
MKSLAVGSMPSSRICGGHWVTRLALSYDADTSGMVPIPIKDMSIIALGKMWVLVWGVGRHWRLLDDDIVEPIRQVELEDIPEPDFEWRQRPRHAEPEQPEPTLRDVMRCSVVAQERRWIMASLSRVIQHLGMDHPHFHQAGPVFPPPAQFRGTNHDGVGTSGTHLGDIDDSEDVTENEENEYDSSDE